MLLCYLTLINLREKCPVEHGPMQVGSLRIKAPKSELLLDFFNSSDPFPNRFDGTSTTNTDNGLTLVASAFTIGDKVVVQVWFGSYDFNNRKGLTFRLLKL
jgi:hypothetical protein